MQNPLIFFVPSNRTDKNGKPTHVDGTNDIIKANRTNRYVGAKQERENVALVRDYCVAAMYRNHWQPLEVKARVYVLFVEVNARRDVSNIYGGLKWVLDGLTRPRGGKDGAGAIVDDSQRWVEVIPSVGVDKEHPGVWIRIEPYEEEGAS